MRSTPLARWRSYWFTPASVTDLGIARIILVGILLYLNGTTRFLRVALVAPEFWKPIPALGAIGMAQPGLATMQWLAWATAALLVAAGVGVGTRAALVLLLPLLLLQEGLINSMGKVGHGTVPALYALLFLTLAPCDRGFSLGAIRRRARAAAAGWIHPPVRRSRYARWPLDLLFIEIGAYYGLAGLAKLRGAGLRWTDGYTLQYFLLDKHTPAGLWLAASPALCTVLSAMVLAFELTVLAGVVRRLRPAVLVGGALFHLGTWVFMDITFWPVVALYTLFVPWTRLGRAVADRTGFAARRLEVVYDGGCGLCRRTLSVIRDLDLARRVRFVDVATASLDCGAAAAMEVREPAGRVSTGFDAFRRLAWALPAAWAALPLLYVPGVPLLGRRVYATVARRRRTTACRLHRAA